MPTFSFDPADAGASVEVSPRTKSISFGDGYSQNVADGINSVRETWNLSWTNRTKALVQSIDSFLRTQAGVVWFDYTTPQGSTKKFLCKKWSPVYRNDYDCDISAVFEQTFNV